MMNREMNAAQHKSSNFNKGLQTLKKKEVNTFKQPFSVTHVPRDVDLRRFKEESLVRLNVEDLPLIYESLCQRGDSLSIEFSCKALKQMLSTGDEKVILHVLKTYPNMGRALTENLASGLSPDIELDILWSLTNMSTMMEPQQINDLVVNWNLYGVLTEILGTSSE